MAPIELRAPPRARLPACLALLCMAGVVAVLVASSGPAGLLILGAGLVGTAVAGAGMWWVLAYRGPVRVAGAVLAVVAPAAVLVGYAVKGLWPVALGAIALAACAVACARAALSRAQRSAGMRAFECTLPEHPVVIMNPKSGGGKVGRFGLVEQAEALGARVVLLDPEKYTDVAQIARQAVADGADLLGVAGGDGTQALVAAIAADHGLPFLVISAGTRNHFAMDLGLDRENPGRCLDALTDGVELRVDLGVVGGQAFVNTASFGAYAQIVQSPAYRDAKAGSALDAMPDLLLGDSSVSLDAQADDVRLSSQQALLVSNNPYAAPQPMAAGGRRPRLDLGVLGLVGIRVSNAAQAAELAVRGSHASSLSVSSARRITVESDAENVPVAIDGEARILPAPVTCSIRPGVLRVLVPRHRPESAAASPLKWRDVIALAVGRTQPISTGEIHGNGAAQ